MSDINWNALDFSPLLGTLGPSAMQQLAAHSEKQQADEENRRRWEAQQQLQWASQVDGPNQRAVEAHAQAMREAQAKAEQDRRALELQRQQHLQGQAQAAAPAWEKARAALDQGDVYGAQAAVSPFGGQIAHVVTPEQAQAQAASQAASQASSQASQQMAGQLGNLGGAFGSMNMSGLIGTLPDLATAAGSVRQTGSQQEAAQADAERAGKGAYRYTDATGNATMYDPLEAARSRDAFQGAKLDSSLAALGNDSTMAPIAKGLAAAGSTPEEAIKAGLARKQHLEDQANADLRAEAQRRAASARHNDGSPDLAYRKEKDQESRTITDLAGKPVGLAATPEEGKKLREMQGSTNTLVSLLGELKADVAANGTALIPFTSAAQARENLQGLLVGKVTEAMASGVLNGAEFPRYKKYFDPRFWQSRDAAIHTLDAFEKEIKLGYEKKIGSQATGSKGAPKAGAGAPAGHLDDAMAKAGY